MNNINDTNNITQINSNDNNKDSYSYKQLSDKNIWVKLNINATQREQYLSDKEFTELFKMNKNKFSLLPLWRQTKLKQELKLF